MYVNVDRSNIADIKRDIYIDILAVCRYAILTFVFADFDLSPITL